MARLMALIKKEQASEQGGALIMAMLVLMVMSIVIMGMATDADLDLKISRNLKLKNQAFNNAETGIALCTEALRYTLSTCRKGDGANDVPEDNFRLSPRYRIETDSSFGDICNLNVDDSLDISVHFEDDNGNAINIAEVDLSLFHLDNDNDNKGYKLSTTGYEENDSRSTVDKLVLTKFKLHNAYDWGLFSEGRINFNGNATIYSDAHTNQYADMQAEGKDEIIGNISASDDVYIKGNHDGETIPDADNEEVPQVTINRDTGLPWTDDEIAKWEKEGKTVENYPSGYDSKEHEGNDLIENKVILSDGPVNIESKMTLRNVTIIAADNITFAGSSKTHDGTDKGVNKNAFITLGDITFNGSTKKNDDESSDSYGVYWCNGDFTHNGSSSIKGSIVASGEIIFNGGSRFEHYDKIDNDHLKKELNLSSGAWKKRY